MSLVDALKWRYATKRYNGKKIEKEQLDFILEAIQLSASSYGLQPYKVLVIENEDIRKKLLPASWNQPQIVEASQLILFTAWSKITVQQIEDFISDIAKKRSLPLESLNEYKNYILGTATNLTEEAQRTWAAKQAYIALGTGLAAAAEIKVDATPMEGFDHNQYDEILGLKEKGLNSVVLLAVGYRSEEDQFSSLAKVRKDKEAFFEFI